MTPEMMAKARAAKNPPQDTACHPERRHYSAGLCQSCYQTARYRRDPERLKACARRWLATHPEDARIHRRRATLKKHGITPEQYEQMWTRQNGKCANLGCAITSPLVVDDYRYGLMVDHDHETGRVRGLLCAGCNTALGHAREDPARLAGLIEYLRDDRRLATAI